MPNSELQSARVKPASKGAAYIADFLIQQKVPYVFGVCGHGILGLLDGLFDRQEEIKTISVHHEAAAGFMAEAYFRITQKPVATYTSCGPGSANLILAIAAAFADSSAMLNITGNVPTGQWNRGPFQETGKYFQGDFVNVVRPYVKRSFQPTRPDMLPLALRQAFALMTNGRPGPVNIDVPLNVFVEPVEESAAQADNHWPAADWSRACSRSRSGGRGDATPSTCGASGDRCRTRRRVKRRRTGIAYVGGGSSHPRGDYAIRERCLRSAPLSKLGTNRVVTDPTWQMRRAETPTSSWRWERDLMTARPAHGFPASLTTSRRAS